MSVSATVALALALVTTVTSAPGSGGPSMGPGYLATHATSTGSGCRVARLPDRRCTPGARFSVNAGEVCVSGYSRRVRNVPESEKHRVYTEYGIRSHARGQYEVDHLIPLELGGSNSIVNVWPEAAAPRPGFHEKDHLENLLHDLVCRGHMTLRKAQSLIANNWVAAFSAYR